MTTTASRYRARKHKVFRSVFQTNVSQPTPRSTPLLSFPKQGEPFGGPHASLSLGQHGLDFQPNDQVRWDRAWHVVTSRIQLPSSVAVEDSFGALAPESQDLDADFYQSLALVLHPGTALPHASHTEDILLWHTQQVRQHFVHHVMPLLAACASQGGQTQVLHTSIQTLEAARRQYLYGLSLIVRGLEEDSPAAAAAMDKFRRDLHAIIGNSLTQGLMDALHGALQQLVQVIIGPDSQGPDPASRTIDESQVSMARDELLGMLESLQKVGLASERFQVVFSKVMANSMVTFVQQAYSGRWKASATAGCMAHLLDWVENHYGRLAVEVLSRLDVAVAWTDIGQSKDIATALLAVLRTEELFDIALNWPESKGGLDDLRLSVTTSQRRLHLTDVFSHALKKRLLHPGRSTLDILQTYISMIRTFHALDQSKVLLDRVAHALQLYLCQRDDAIRIVVIGLLSSPDTNDAEEAKTKLVELAVLLNSASQQQRRQIDDEDLDWDDMNWVPDPADAGPNYKRPRNEDVIGTLISALGSQDIFIKEFQLIIAERLLSNQPSFTQEMKVLGLLKKRFGEGALQNCDVMMKDIQDSKRVDPLLTKNLNSKYEAGTEPMAFHSKILSRLFWPSLPKDPFTVPPPVAKLQSQYEQGFEELKSSRKLTWLDHLGRATVKLELEDRTLELECKTYEAAVIYAFQESEGSESSGSQQRTFNEIWEKLMIDEDLLDLALRFWVNKRVLRDVGNQTFVVVERLDKDGQAVEAADASKAGQGEESRQTSPRKPKSIDVKEKERRVVYWQFIVGMLTNSAPAMPLGQILMMMKMLIADGCSWSNEELQEFLGDKVAEGELELAGGKYRLPKK